MICWHSSEVRLDDWISTARLEWTMLTSCQLYRSPINWVIPYSRGQDSPAAADIIVLRHKGWTFPFSADVFFNFWKVEFRSKTSCGRTGSPPHRSRLTEIFKSAHNSYFNCRPNLNRICVLMTQHTILSNSGITRLHQAAVGRGRKSEQHLFPVPAASPSNSFQVVRAVGINEI